MASKYSPWLRPWVLQPSTDFPAESISGTGFLLAVWKGGSSALMLAGLLWPQLAPKFILSLLWLCYIWQTNGNSEQSKEKEEAKHCT